MKDRLKIKREFYENCTTGDVTFGDFKCKSLELPWLDNAQDISCIPNGIYRGEKYLSNTHGKCFKICEVPFRTLVRGHIGNFVSCTQGCVLFGRTLKDFNNDGIIDVTESAVTFRGLMKRLPEKFIIEIGQPDYVG